MTGCICCSICHILNNNIKSRLSARGAKRDVEYTPKCTHLNCILAPRSRPLGFVGLWASSHKLLIRPPFIVHKTKWFFEQMPLSSLRALFEMEQMTWWWITSAKCTFTRIWLLSCRSDLLPSTYLPLRYQVTHTLVSTSLDRITFVVSGII